MKKTVKGGFVLAALLAGNAQAALVQVDLTGTINYGYQSNYDYDYNTGVSNNTYNDLSGQQAHFSFLFDTSKAADQSYSYSDPWNNYAYSYSYFDSAVSSVSANLGGQSVSTGNTTAYVGNENWYGSSYNYAGIYSNNYTSSSNSYEYDYLGLYSYGSNSVDVNDFLAAFLSSANPLSFYLEKYVGNWSNDAYNYDYVYAYGTFTNFFVSPVGGFSESPAAVPVPAAVWLFGSALMGLVGLRKKKGMMPELSA